MSHTGAGDFQGSPPPPGPWRPPASPLTCAARLPLALLGVALGLLDLDVGAPAGLLVLGPPVVARRRRPVGGALDVAIEGLPELAGPVAAPPVLPALVHLVEERVVHLQREVSRVSAPETSRRLPSALPLSPFLTVYVGKTPMFSFFSKGHFDGKQQLMYHLGTCTKKNKCEKTKK